jgi:S1-C subfamily serine protease
MFRLSVIAVIKGSPAFRSDFFKGDILRKIGDTDMYEVKDFQAALQKYEGQNVNVQFVRDSKEQEKDVKFNHKPE